MLRICVLSLGLMVTGSAMADWSATAEAGLVIATGNTETETANAKLALANEVGAWKHSFGASALYASSDAQGTTAQRWEVLGQSDYNFSPRNFAFGSVRYEDDEFSGFEYQASAAVGLGHKFIESERTNFSGTAGVGYKFYETRDVFDEATGALLDPGESDSEVILRGTLDLDHRLTDTTSLIDRFIVEAGADNTFLQNDLSLQVKMTDVLALAVGYSVRHNTDPPLSFEKTDTLTTINLVYELK